MSQPLERTVPMQAAWCGRSWEGLVDRRYATFAQAQALRHATVETSLQAVDEFLEFFDSTGVDLFRDEEEWVFSSLQPTPEAVLRALEEHIEICALVTALIHEADAGCVDLRVIHGLGQLLEGHLLEEEAEVRPLLLDRPKLVLAP